MNRCRPFLLVCLFGVTTPAFAQTTTGGTTGTTGGSTTGGAATGGGSTVSSSGGGTASRAGATTGNGAGGPFSGTVPSGFSGGNAASTATNSATGAAAGTSSVPTVNNPWRTTYGNPYAIGQSVMGGTTAGKTGAAKGFGQPIYTTSTTNVGVTGLNQNTSKSGAGFNNMNLSKSPRYTTALGDDIAIPTHTPAQLQAKVQEILARSTQIRDGRQIRVVVDGDRVFLVGNVGSERERRIAESMIRLTPGVGNVENRLALSGQP